LYRLVGNTWREAQVLTSLAMVASAHGHYQKAEIFLDESLAIQRSLGDTIGMADTLKEMSTTLAEFGDFKKMALFVQEHAIILRELSSPAQLAENLMIESVNVCYLGRFAESARLMEEAIVIYENLGNQSRCMLLRCLLGWVEVNEGLYDQGCEHYQASLTVARQLGDLYGIALNLLGLSEIFLIRREYAQARQVLEESVPLYCQVHQEDELSISLAELADIEFRLGLFQQARSHLRESLQIAAETGSWQACLFVAGKTALFMTMQEEAEKGVELYALATRYPYLGDSCFWEDTAGKRIAEFATGLPEEVVTAAKERGRQRNLHATVRELLGEFESADRG
jgi:tetratricopeptide (TPR) repeat protein